MSWCLQGNSFECLPRLRELRVAASVPPKGVNPTYNETIQVGLAGLPSGLKTLEVGITYAGLPLAANDPCRPLESSRH